MQQIPRRVDLEVTFLFLEAVEPHPTPGFNQRSTSIIRSSPRSTMEPELRLHYGQHT
jgi:hypothetical protein